MSSKQCTYKDLYAQLSAARREPIPADRVKWLEENLVLCWRCMTTNEREPFFAPEVLLGGLQPVDPSFAGRRSLL